MFRDLDTLREAHGRGEGCLAERARRDYTLAISAARQQVFHGSRPCDGFFHLVQKHSTLDKISRDANVEDQAGVVNAFLNDQRSAPTLDIASAMTKAMFERLRRELTARRFITQLSRHVQEISNADAQGLHLDPRPNGRGKMIVVDIQRYSLIYNDI